MKTVDKIIFNDKEYNKLYNGYELLFEVKREVEWKGLTFTALEPSTILYKPSTVSTAQYSYDTVNWKTADNVTLNLSKGDKIYFKGNIVGDQSKDDYAHFTMTGKIAASGSIMSLQAGNTQDKSLKYKYEFYNLFIRCTSIVTAPELPAITLIEHCYDSMFEYCSSIVTAPELPATTLKDWCYMDMFSDCTSLIKAPELPATTLAYRCYGGMFYNCTSLVTAPVLPATKLVSLCYAHIFAYCYNLNYVKCDAREYNSDYFYMWVKDITTTGDFYCYDASIFQTGTSGIPSGWTVHSEV